MVSVSRQSSRLSTSSKASVRMSRQSSKMSTSSKISVKEEGKVVAQEEKQSDKMEDRIVETVIREECLVDAREELDDAAEEKSTSASKDEASRDGLNYQTNDNVDKDANQEGNESTAASCPSIDEVDRTKNERPIDDCSVVSRSSSVAGSVKGIFERKSKPLSVSKVKDDNSEGTFIFSGKIDEIIEEILEETKDEIEKDVENGDTEKQEEEEKEEVKNDDTEKQEEEEKKEFKKGGKADENFTDTPLVIENGTNDDTEPTEEVDNHITESVTEQNAEHLSTTIDLPMDKTLTTTESNDKNAKRSPSIFKKKNMRKSNVKYSKPKLSFKSLSVHKKKSLDISDEKNHISDGINEKDTKATDEENIAEKEISEVTEMK